MPIEQSTIINPLVIETAQVQPKEEEPTQYVIQDGDNLSKIATKYNTTWQRLWSKNTNLTNQDVLNVGETLTIPKDDEVIPERPAYFIQVVPQTVDVSSNTYQRGQCVWFVKNMRPELPNTWGSAISWLSNARADGWPTGSVPRVNAVGVSGNHVVLITAVNGDGTVNYTDMNGRWVPFEIGYGTKPASYYSYIY